MMTESFQILATLAAAQIVLAMSPGPNTLLVAHAATRGSRYGFAVAAGIWPVGIAWAVLGLTGLGAVFTRLPELAETMRIVCGLYLGWLGVKSVRASFAEETSTGDGRAEIGGLAAAFRAGVVSNLTNPKSVAYYMSIFAATGTHDLSATEQALAVAMMPSISFAWNLMLATAFGSTAARRIFVRGRRWIDRVAGGVMLAFGARLLFSRD